MTDATDQTFEDEVVRSTLPVLVDFWAPWCSPCEAVARLLDAISEEYAGQVKIVRVNTDDNAELARRYDVQGLPTVVVFAGGRALASAIGVRPKEEYARFLHRALATT
jgi:thioredoxin